MKTAEQQWSREMGPVNNCDHHASYGYYAETVNDWTGELEREWKTEERCLQVDLDLHRFQCTRCKEIGYYSGAARAYYEEGKRAPGVQGLE
jgi:hypothetical protein